MKNLVIGTQLSGKTTLVRHLRETTRVPVSEIDEEILDENDGRWPDSNEFKDNVLVPRIYKRMQGEDNRIFFANYFSSMSLLECFRESGYVVVLLEAPLEVLEERNEKRMREEGYEDATPWLKGQLENHQKISDAGLVDRRIDATLPTEEIAAQILSS